MKYSYDRTAARGTQALDYLNLPTAASSALWDLDEKFIGTDNYMGVAFFWSIEYKWWLREASPKVRRAVHAAFRKARLPVEDDSAEHRAIIGKFFPDAKTQLADREL
jgi:hypothetical protein